MPDTIPLSLPHDLVLVILSRLPIESILRCRSICKSWKDITQDPHFISLQLSKCNIQPSRFLMTTNAILGSYSSCFLLDLIVVKANKLFSCGLDNPEFMCSYNGLIFLAPRYHLNPLIICNPITREYLISPQSNFRGVVMCHQVALGYDDSTKRYKVVRSYRTDADAFPGRIEMLILGERVWKELTATESFSYEKHGPVCDGAFYWIAGQFHQYYLLLLDISSEKFLIAPERFYFRTISGDMFTSLLNLEGRLILAIHDSDTFALWMFRLNGSGAGSLYVMQHPNILRENGAFCFNVKLISMPSQGDYMLGVIVISFDLTCRNKVLVNYHPETRAVVFYDMNFPDGFNVMEFKPSLVSPNMVASLETA